MRCKILFALVLVASFLMPTSMLAQQNSDADLDKLPTFYRKRIKAFRALIRAESTKEAKIKKALQLAMQQDSTYRKDAIRFLVEVDAKETTPTLIKLAKKNPPLRGEVAVAMSKFQSKEAIDYLVDLLLDNGRSPNVRNIAFLNLRKITKQNFYYNSEDTVNNRRTSHKKWKAWWDRNRANFKREELSAEEKQDAEEIWQKYGLKYLDIQPQGNSAKTP